MEDQLSLSDISHPLNFKTNLHKMVSFHRIVVSVSDHEHFFWEQSESRIFRYNDLENSARKILALIGLYKIVFLSLDGNKELARVMDIMMTQEKRCYTLMTCVTKRNGNNSNPYLRRIASLQKKLYTVEPSVSANEGCSLKPH